MTKTRSTREKRTGRPRPTDAAKGREGASQVPAPTAQRFSCSSPLTLALLLGLLAFAVRALYLIESGENPFRIHLDLDPRNYHEWALTILRGEAFGTGPFLQAPLYPYFLALCYLILGVDLIAPLWVQAVLAAGTVTLAALIAHRYWGRRGLLATGLVMALYKPAIFYTGVLLVPVLATALAATALFWAPRRRLLAGLATGLAGLAHPTILPGTALVAFVMAGTPRAHSSGAPPLRAREAVSFRWPDRRAVASLLVGIVLGIAPATVYNLVRTGDWVPISANTGINLYIGNGPEANGFYRAPFGMRGEVDPCGIAEAGRLAGEPLDAVEANRFWVDAAIEAAGQQPGRVAGLVAMKFWAALGAFEVPQIESFDFEKRFSLLLRLPFLPGWIALLLLSAAALAVRPRDRLLWALLGGVLLTAAVMAIFFVTGRFRLPAHLFLALASGGAVAAILSGLTAAERGRAAAVVILTGVAFVPNWAGIQKDATFAQYHYRLGVIAEREDRDQDALEQYRASLAIDPNVARANINLGVLTARRGDLEQARRLLERGTRLDPRSARALLALGQIEEVEGDLGAAAGFYRQAWSVDSTFVRALESWMAAEYRMGDLERTRALALDLLGRVGEDPMGARARFVLHRLNERATHGLPLAPSPARAQADLLLAAGKPGEAAGAYQAAAQQAPGDPVPALELARLLTVTGREEEAARWIEQYRARGGPAELLPTPASP